jgi:hypothetical protein
VLLCRDDRAAAAPRFLEVAEALERLEACCRRIEPGVDVAARLHFDVKRQFGVHVLVAPRRQV